MFFTAGKKYVVLVVNFNKTIFCEKCFAENKTSPVSNCRQFGIQRFLPIEENEHTVNKDLMFTVCKLEFVKKNHRKGRHMPFPLE